MKKHRKAKLFLEEIQKTPVVAAVCNKLNISRQSVYRWLSEDFEFRSLYKEALSHGSDNVNDLAESKMIGSIDRGEPWAIKYWLESNHKKYLRPRLPADNLRTSKEDDIDGINIQVRTTKYNESNDPRDEDPNLQPNSSESSTSQV
jgi:hypothetical protein